MKRTVGTLVGALASILAVGAASAANPPPTGNAAFRACLKTHGVTLGKTTDQKKIGAAFVACRSSSPGGGGFAGGRRKLSPAQRAAFRKYTACLAKHGVKISFGPGQRPSGRRPDRTSAKLKAAQKACASLRPKLPGGGPPAPQ